MGSKIPTGPFISSPYFFWFKMHSFDQSYKHAVSFAQMLEPGPIVAPPTVKKAGPSRAAYHWHGTWMPVHSTLKRSTAHQGCKWGDSIATASTGQEWSKKQTLKLLYLLVLLNECLYCWMIVTMRLPLHMGSVRVMFSMPLWESPLIVWG